MNDIEFELGLLERDLCRKRPENEQRFDAETPLGRMPVKVTTTTDNDLCTLKVDFVIPPHRFDPSTGTFIAYQIPEHELRKLGF